MSTSTRTVAPETRPFIRPQATHQIHLQTARQPQTSRPQPRAPEWVRVVLTVVAMLVAAFSALLLTLVPGFPEMFNSSDPVTSTIARTITPLVVLPCFLLMAFLLTRYLDRRPMAVLGLRATTRSMTALAGATALAAGLVTLGTAVTQLAGATGVAGTDLSVLPVPLLIANALAVPFFLQGIGEELLWRGYIMQSLSSRPKRALWISALTFAAMHLLSGGGQQNLLDHFLYLVAPFGFALLGGTLALQTRSVWAAIGIHGGYHVGTVITRLLGLGAPSIITQVIIGLVMAVLALMVARTITPQRWAEIAQRGPFAPAQATQ